jgi:hypothetical protein
MPKHNNAAHTSHRKYQPQAKTQHHENQRRGGSGDITSGPNLPPLPPETFVPSPAPSPRFSAPSTPPSPPTSWASRVTPMPAPAATLPTIASSPSPTLPAPTPTPINAADSLAPNMVLILFFLLVAKLLFGKNFADNVTAGREPGGNGHTPGR